MHINYTLKYLAIIVFIIAGYFILYWYSNPIEGYTVCPFKLVTGIPCPACGSTRATIHLLNGHLLKSVQINPFGLVSTILLMISVLWMLLDIFRKKETFFKFLKKNWSLEIKTLLFLIVIINWIFNIYKGL